MYCKFCGMDSRTPSVCEWCHKVLAGPQAGTVASGPLLEVTQQPAVQQRVSLTGEVVTVPVSSPAGAVPGAGPVVPPSVPTLHPTGGGAPTATLAGRPSVSTYGLQAAAINTTMIQQQLDQYRVTTGERWERFLAMAMPLMLVSVVVVHYAPQTLQWIAIADMFIISMMMGATGAVGSYDDEYLDVGSALMVTLLFGPLVGLVGYTIVGVLKQDPNWSIINLLSGHLFVRGVLWVAFMAGGVSGSLSLMPAFFAIGVIEMLGPLVTFLGWMLSSFFRPLNE